MKRWIAAALACVTLSAHAISIGSFGRSAVNYTDAALENGGEYDQLRAEFLRRGDTVSSLDRFSAASLANIDVFYTSLPDSLQRQSTEELEALLAWVQAGGTFISAGEYAIGFDRYNNLLAPFGVSVVTDLPYWATASVNGSASPIVNGPNGTVSSFNFYAAGGFAGDDLDVLAVEAGAPILIHKTVGRGQLIAIGDQNLFTDSYIGANEKILFLNMLDSASTTPVPEPDASSLLAMGLAAMGLVGWQRRRARLDRN